MSDWQEILDQKYSQWKQMIDVVEKYMDGKMARKGFVPMFLSGFINIPKENYEEMKEEEFCQKLSAIVNGTSLSPLEYTVFNKIIECKGNIDDFQDIFDQVYDGDETSQLSENIERFIDYCFGKIWFVESQILEKE